MRRTQNLYRLLAPTKEESFSLRQVEYVDLETVRQGDDEEDNEKATQVTGERFTPGELVWVLDSNGVSYILGGVVGG